MHDVLAAIPTVPHPALLQVYDAYGVKGLQASSELVKYCTTRAEIIAECKARERLRKEIIKHAMASEPPAAKLNSPMLRSDVSRIIGTDFCVLGLCF